MTTGSETTREPTPEQTAPLPTVTLPPIPTLTPASPTRTPEEEKAAAVHTAAFVIDTHCDTVLKIISSTTWLPKTNLGQSTAFMVDLPKLRAGGIDLQVFAAFTGGYARSGGGQDFDRANSRLLALLNALHWTLQKNPQTTRLILSQPDIDQIRRDGKTGLMLSIEGAYSFAPENGVALLRQYHDLGVRMIGLVWNNANALGEGADQVYKDGTPSSGGLTDLGCAVIAEMNRLGIIIDVSHMNERTFWDTVSASTAPLIASHSSVYSLCAHVRNLKDDQIRAIAAGGGVIQVNFHRPFLSVKPDTVTLSTLVDHIDAIVSLVGVDYVGLGSDFDGATMPHGLENAAKLPDITAELLRRGYAESDVHKILGGNAARVFADIWARASAPAAISGPSLDVAFAAGSGFASAQPTLSATVSPASGHTLDLASLQIVLDGTIHAPDFNGATGLMSLTPASLLQEKFHVVTFVAADNSGRTTRATRIFYVR
jgi:membrane dipeptidase